MSLEDDLKAKAAAAEASLLDKFNAVLASNPKKVAVVAFVLGFLLHAVL